MAAVTAPAACDLRCVGAARIPATYPALTMQILDCLEIGRHTRVSILRVGDGMAIWGTSLTSGDTILTWTPAGMVAVD